VLVKDITLPINDAIPIGLIAKELLTNAYKHAFPAGRKGEFRIAKERRENNSTEFIIEDNGVGIPDHIDIFGKKLWVCNW